MLPNNYRELRSINHFRKTHAAGERDAFTHLRVPFLAVLAINTCVQLVEKVRQTTDMSVCHRQKDPLYFSEGKVR
jgi:hypothetical protein